MTQRCPRFSACSASVCPLDRAWRERVYEARTDRVCLWLLEAVKPGGRAVLSGALPSDLASHVLDTLPAIRTRYVTVARKLDRAAGQQSRVLAGQALREVA